MKIVFIFLAVFTCFSGATARANETEQCRAQTFATLSKSYRLAEIQTETPLLRDWNQCPEAGIAKCASSKKLAKVGTPVVVAKQYKDWSCIGIATPDGYDEAAWVLTTTLNFVETPVTQWEGVYRFGENEITLSRDSGMDELKVQAKLFWHGSGSKYEGTFNGQAKPIDDTLDIVELRCTVAIRKVGSFLLVHDNRGCGGLNVRANGIYTRLP